MRPKIIETPQQKPARVQGYRDKFNLKRKMLRVMERYWFNYENGVIVGKQKGQVAPLAAYRPPVRNIVQTTPEDIAWVRDPEGVMLGKYDF